MSAAAAGFGVWGLGFRGFGVLCLGLYRDYTGACVGMEGYFMVQGLGLWGLGLWGLGVGVWDLGFRVCGLGFRIL